MAAIVSLHRRERVMSGGECTCAGESLQGDRTEWIARLPVEVSRLGLVGADEPCASAHADARCHIPLAGVDSRCAEQPRLPAVP